MCKNENRGQEQGRLNPGKGLQPKHCLGCTEKGGKCKTAGYGQEESSKEALEGLPELAQCPQGRFSGDKGTSRSSCQPGNYRNLQHQESQQDAAQNDERSLGGIHVSA